MARTTGTWHEEQYIFFIISHSVPLRMRNVADKLCREYENTLFMFSNPFFFRFRAVYGVIWKNTVQPCRPDVTIWRMCIACWIPKATNIHSQYVIIIFFLQWIHERPSMLRCTYIACLVIFLSCDHRLQSSVQISFWFLYCVDMAEVI
jgi:hypothetical protein